MHARAYARTPLVDIQPPHKQPVMYVYTVSVSIMLAYKTSLPSAPFQHHHTSCKKKVQRISVLFQDARKEKVRGKPSWVLYLTCALAVIHMVILLKKRENESI